MRTFAQKPGHDIMFGAGWFAPGTYAAQSALLDWKEKADAFVDGTRGWMAANWTAYLGLTSSNPSLGWQESFIYGVTSNLIGNMASEAAAKVAFDRFLKKGAVKAGAAAAGAVAGAAIGNVPWGSDRLPARRSY